MSTLTHYDAVLHYFNTVFRKVEAEEGICAEAGDCFLTDEDREPPDTLGLCDPIPMPRDPFRQLSDDEE